VNIAKCLIRKAFSGDFWVIFFYSVILGFESKNMRKSAFEHTSEKARPRKREKEVSAWIWRVYIIFKE
jgi:hypothetical protein